MKLEVRRATSRDSDMGRALSLVDSGLLQEKCSGAEQTL